MTNDDVKVGDVVSWFDIGPMRQYTGTVEQLVSSTMLKVRRPGDQHCTTTVFICDLVKPHQIPSLGAKVYVARERRGYVVRARNERFAVCTKPHFKTVLYFILDAVNGVRGTENLVFGFGAETDEDCEEMLERVSSGQTEVSHRNRVPWDVR